MLGAGNTAYAQGQLERAAAAYQAAASQHADFADAWNNLAQVRLELGQLSDAQQAARQAVALGGVRLANYQTLLNTIESKLAASPTSGTRR
jgi:tetratricopeptide (TPR) repeat protein